MTTVSKFLANPAPVLNAVMMDGPQIITNRSRPDMVIVNASTYEMLEESVETWKARALSMMDSGE